MNQGMSFEAEQDKKEQEKKKIQWILIKSAVTIVSIFILFAFVLGLCRISNDAMSPAARPSDLVLFTRINLTYDLDDVVVIKKDGKKQVMRVVAVPGDTVEIKSDGLYVNGYRRQEDRIYSDTLAYKDGIQYPYEVKDDEVFVLGDNREKAEDSRLYGAVSKKELKGVVITLLRVREL